jgi:hypothetical protein
MNSVEEKKQAREFFLASINGNDEDKTKALYEICRVYGIQHGKAVMRYDSKIEKAYAISIGKTDVCFGPLFFDPKEEFGVIVRVIAHELIHVEQKTKLFPIRSHNERELLAYCDTLFRTDLPSIERKYTLRFFTEKAIDYYTKLSTWKKWRYKSLYERLIKYQKEIS